MECSELACVEQPSDGRCVSSESTEAPKLADSLTPLQEVQNKVKTNWDSRLKTSRYKRVIVLLLSWEEHDLGDMDKTLGHFRTIFEALYKYEVWPFKIPMEKSSLALAEELVKLANEDGADNLFVVWYDGHGREDLDQQGSPLWCSHEDE